MLYLSDFTPYSIVLIVLCIIAFLGAITCVIYLINKKSKKNSSYSLISGIFESLGGKENIKELYSKGSRLTFILYDKEKLNEPQLKNLGITSIIYMSNKTTIIIGSLAQDIEKAFKKN